MIFNSCLWKWYFLKVKAFSIRVFPKKCGLFPLSMWHKTSFFFYLNYLRQIRKKKLFGLKFRFRWASPFVNVVWLKHILLWLGFIQKLQKPNIVQVYHSQSVSCTVPALEGFLFGGIKNKRRIGGWVISIARRQASIYQPLQEFTKTSYLCCNCRVLLWW